MPRLAHHFPPDLIQKLAGRSNPAMISAAVDYLIPACGAASAPLKSLHAYLRLLAQHGVPDRAIAAILDAVRGKLPAPAPRPGSVEWAAKVRGVSPRSIKRKLHTVAGRRLYGWPMWTGHEWDIPVAAAEPTTRGPYLQSLPADEPEAQKRSLPPWCEREVQPGDAAA